MFVIKLVLYLRRQRALGVADGIQMRPSEVEKRVSVVNKLVLNAVVGGKMKGFKFI